MSRTVGLPSLHSECICKSPRYCCLVGPANVGSARIRWTSARLRKCRRSCRRRSISARRPLSSIARSTVDDPPVSRISRMTRADPGPIPGIRGNAPPESTRSVRGTPSARIAAAARLYPNIFCCEDCAKAKSRRNPPMTALISAKVCAAEPIGPLFRHLFPACVRCDGASRTAKGQPP